MAKTRQPKPVRTPVQARALRRRESLLDATARILDRGGYDALTTNAVAAEAQTAVGTVYEYFPSREALLAGLLARYAVRLDERIDAVLASAGSWQETADRLVDELARLWRDEPGYRAAWTATQVSDLLARVGADWSDRFTAKLAGVLAAVKPSVPERDRERVAFTAVHLVSGLLLAAMTAPKMTERRRAELVAEAKIALRAYLRAQRPR